jgi:hypothetical protein
MLFCADVAIFSDVMQSAASAGRTADMLKAADPPSAA